MSFSILFISIFHQVVSIFIQLHKYYASFDVSSRCGNDSKFEVLALTGKSAHSFPNPVPVETRVPQWALLDVTVRCHLPFPTSHILMTQVSLRIIGTPASRRSSVVGIFLLAILRRFHTCVFLGNQEITGPSPTPSPSGRSALFYGTIAASVSGGIVVIAIAILGGFYLQRRRSKIQSAVIVANSTAHPYSGSRNPLADDGARELSSMPGAPPVTGHVSRCVVILLVSQNLNDSTLLNRSREPSSSVRRDSDSSSRPPSYRTIEPESP